MKVRIFLLTVLFAVSLIFNLSLRVPNQAVVQAQATSNCLTTEIPVVTIGSNNDSFLLPDPLKFTLLNAGGDASFFATNDQNFGGNATLTRIAQAGGSAKGLAISSVGGKAVALSCRDAFWDINFMLASMGATAGDKVRLFMQPDETGKGAFDLARFEVAAGSGGANLTYLEPTSKLSANGHVEQKLGAFLPYNIGAGQSGKRTDQISISLSMDKKAPTMTCLHLGIEIVRDGGMGSSSIVFNDIVLVRAGKQASGTGLFTGQPGNYPTETSCDRVCPACQITCVRADVPATTVGANNDQFLLKDPLKLTLTDSSGAAGFFATNDLNFGGNATLTRIIQAGRAAQGLRAEGVGSSATAISCRDHFWDINFMIAAAGASAGDKIRLFMQSDENGKGVFDVARFEVAPGGGGVTLTYLEPSAQLYGNGHVQQNVNSFLPFGANAGTNGKRTDQIVIALSMDKKAPTMGCQHLGVQIVRDGGTGSTAVVFNSFVLVRDNATTASGTGLFTGQTGSYPTKAECDGACPSCCRTGNISAVVNGSNNDVFLLPEPFKLSLGSGAGDASFFSTNAANFGSNATLTRIMQQGGSGLGFKLSSVGGKASAVSCRDSIWDLNFMLAGAGATGGDRIRLLLQPDQTGKGAVELATFTVANGGGGVNVSQLEKSAALYGNGHVQQNVGAFIPYSFNAGSSGKRTDQMVIALSMDQKAPTMGCNHLVVEIIRDGGMGTSAIVFNDVVLIRSGPNNGIGTGLFTGVNGNYPTKAECDGACPKCDN